MKIIQDIVALFRVKQWVKNIFILFPLFFSGQFDQLPRVLNCLITFFGFCFIASGVYILNDLLDARQDRLHPRKAKRPLSQGEINKPAIFMLIAVVFSFGLGMLWVVSIDVAIMAIIYILLHFGYNFYAKKIVLLDVIFVAFGFQIRIWSGALAVEIIPSVWLQLCVFLLALFLGFAKRRYEISSLKDKGVEHRSVLAHYTAYLLDQIIIICSTLAIVFYGLYTISSDIAGRIGSHNMLYTVIFVVYGIFRYLYLIHVRKLGDEPGELLFLDKPLMINIILWILSIGLIVYLR